MARDSCIRSSVVSFPRAMPMLAASHASNDPKLSDRGVRRGSCAEGLRGAATVTHGAVLCSAWLGVAIWVRSSAKGKPNVEKLPPVAVTCAQKRRATPGELRWALK